MKNNEYKREYQCVEQHTSLQENGTRSGKLCLAVFKDQGCVYLMFFPVIGLVTCVNFRF